MAGLREEFNPGSSKIPLQDMIDRMLFAEALETQKCFDEGVIETTADANIGSIMGIGFPPWTGGAAQFITQVPRWQGASFVARAQELAARTVIDQPAGVVAGIAAISRKVLGTAEFRGLLRLPSLTRTAEVRRGRPRRKCNLPGLRHRWFCRRSAVMRRARYSARVCSRRGIIAERSAAWSFGLGGGSVSVPVGRQRPGTTRRCRAG